MLGGFCLIWPRPPVRIITTTEVAGESTGKVVDHFQLTGVSYKTAHLLKDKVAMRKLLAEHDLSPVAYRHVTCAQDAIDFVAEHGRSVLKPAEGPSHSEFVLTDKGPRVLESHACLAGSGAPELVRRAFGLDLNRMFLTVPLGIDELPLQSPQPKAGAAIQFFVPTPGTVRKVELDLKPDVDVRHTRPGETPRVFLPFLFELGEAQQAVVIQKHEGDTIPALDTVADCVSGYVLATGSSREDAVRIGDELVQAVHFIMEPKA